jgi:hypothetical protein
VSLRIESKQKATFELAAGELNWARHPRFSRAEQLARSFALGTIRPNVTAASGYARLACEQ